MIIVTDTWALGSDGSTQWTVFSRPTAEASATSRGIRVARGMKVNDGAERTWKPVAYHSRLEDAAGALLDRMILDAGAGAGTDVAWLARVVRDAKVAICEAVKSAGVTP
jgi:hypothetical protein